HLDRAARMLAREVARFPSPELVILLGDVYSAAGEPREARRQYSLVRAMARLYRAGGVETDLEMALFATDHGDRPAAALRMARDAYRRRPSIHAADAVAWALHAAGRDEQARRYAREALRLGTRSAMFHFHAGMIALDLDERAAVRHLRSALEINPHFSLVHAPTARRELERLVP
ncbi:MAG: tetratricopeptide repeat protein, partial [Actinomycetota bacterium]